MKKEHYNTGYVQLKAYTDSQWDYCDFVIIHITEQWLQAMQQRLDALAPFKEDYSFCRHTYWDSPEGFYRNPDDEALSADEIIGEQEDWCFVSLDADELERFPVPENILDAYQLHIDKYGLAQFVAYGKHTGEEFYTADFNVAKLIAATTYEQNFTL